MLYGMYVSAAGALANSYRQDVIANNLANVDTVAFKRDLALFQARQTQAAQTGQRPHSAAMLEGIGGGTFALPTHTDFTPGSLSQTGGEYDLALDGPGFFAVQNGSDVQYTRDGRLTCDSDHVLVTAEGKLPVLDASGKPISLSPQARDFVVSPNGVISQDGAVVARLGVVNFDDPRSLRKEGANLYKVSGDQSAQEINTPVKQKCLENSGIDSVSEMVNLIKAQRSFQLNMSMLQLQDQTLGMAVNKLGSITE